MNLTGRVSYTYVWRGPPKLTWLSPKLALAK